MPGIGELVIILIILAFIGVPGLIVLLVVLRKRTPQSAEAAQQRATWYLQQHSQALAQLGLEALEARLVAVQTLERLAYEEPPLRPATWDALQGFIHGRGVDAPASDELPPPDVQAARDGLARMRSWG